MTRIVLCIVGSTAAPQMIRAVGLIAFWTTSAAFCASLTVMSGLRYVRHAAKLGRPVVIVNQGATRGDPYATATLDAPLGQTLSALVRSLAERR